MNKKVAVVTGANRGIGKEISKQLANLGLKVIVTSRDEQKGKKVYDELMTKNLDVVYHQLDVTDVKSIENLKQFLIKEYDGCDVLVNNAGIFPDTTNASGGFPSVFDSNPEIISKAMTTNVYGPLLLIQNLVPLMKKRGYGRIVNLSSGMGQLTHMNGGCPAYRISKTSLNALTRIVADELKGGNIKINCMCPGWVKTDMGGPNATRELEEGAETAAWLATLPDDGPSGGYFRDRKVFEW